MIRIILIIVALTILSFASIQSLRMSLRSLRMNIDKQSVVYESVAVSGFVSKKAGFAEPNVFSSLFAKGSIRSLVALTDDEQFARKRLVTPKNVYAGVVDVLQYEEQTLSEKSLRGVDALVCFDVSPSDVPSVCANLVATQSKVSRVVIAVNCSDSSNGQFAGEGVTFPESCELLQKAGIDYTILKFGQVRRMEEGKYPYRVVRGSSALPSMSPSGSVSSQGLLPLSPLSSEDLQRVVCEVLDIPKTFNQVFGIGPGSALDAEILIYMKSQGWPERVQVTMLMGDLMDTIEAKFAEEQKRIAAANNNQLPVKKVEDDGVTLRVPKEGNKYAGFFTG